MRKLFKAGVALLVGTVFAVTVSNGFSVEAKDIEMGHYDEAQDKFVYDWEWKYDDKGEYLENVSTGERAPSGWNKIGDADYYFDEGGYRSTSNIINGMPNGYISKSVDAKGPFTWKSDSKGTYYVSADGFKLGNVPAVDNKNNIKYWTYKIDGEDYVFTNDGYLLVSSWFKKDDNSPSSGWYYTDETGKLCNGWKMIDGKWYFFYKNGRMASGPTDVDQNTDDSVYDYYVLKEDGTLADPGWVSIDGTWFYLDENSKPYTGWQKVDGYWYYFTPESGSMASSGVENIAKDEGREGFDLYIFNDDGSLAGEGWCQIHEKYSGYNNDIWYYVDADGKPYTGWQKIDGSWYYFNYLGQMLSDGWQDGYYLASSGVMDENITGDWYQDDKGWYFMDSTGWYPSNIKGYSINGSKYSFDSDGYLIQ